MIKSIRLQDWRSHHDTAMQFREGTNLLVGIMGSGKSSVMDGISFALFGTFPALEKRRLKLEDVVRLNAGEAKVALEFEWNGTAYRAERSIIRSKRGTSSEASLYRDGMMLESGSRAVTAYVEQLLGTDYGLFSRAIYSEQNNIDHFLNLDPRVRKQEMDSLLGLDRFEAARANIVSVINRMRADRKALEERFDPARAAGLEAQEKALKEKAGSLEARAGQSSESAATGRSLLEASLKSFSGLKATKERFDALSRENLKLSGSIESLRKEMAGKEAGEARYAELVARAGSVSKERTAAMESARRQEEEFSRLSKEAGQLESAIRSHESDGRKLAEMRDSMSRMLDGRTLESLRGEALALEKEAISLNAERASAASRMKETEDLSHALRPGTAQCPLCGSPLTEGHMLELKKENGALLEGLRRRIAEISVSLPKASAARERAVSLIRSIEIAEQKAVMLSSGQDKLPELKERRASMEKMLAEASNARAASHSIAEALQKELQALSVSASQTKALVEKGKELFALEKRLSANESAMRAMNFDEAAFDSARQGLEDLRLKCERLSAEERQAMTELSSARQLLPMVSKELQSMRDTAARMAAIAKLDEELSVFKNALLETQMSLRAGLTEAINSAMNEVWSIFYPYRNYPSLRLSVSEKDYLFEVYDGSAWKALESVASGGERASAALTLRVALSMVLTPALSWLILDEPTHNLDREAISLLSETLQLKVPDVVKQTFVITHEEALMGSEFASSYRLKRDKERNAPTECESM